MFAKKLNERLGHRDETRQETNSFDSVGDSFKKIIVIGRSIKPRRNEKGYLIIGIKEFLLDANSLDF